MRILPRILRSEEERQAETYRALIRREAKIGGELFGPIPAGHSREFFCLDEHTWVWHEQWTDKQGKRQVVTTRYDVRPGGVIKIQNNQLYQSLNVNEAVNLYRAVELYEQRIGAMYGQMQAA